MDSVECFAAARVWLKKAESDLATARLLIEGTERHLDTGSYHCQQCAEKSLKAWLCAKGIPFPKLHELERLLDLCVPVDPSFETLRQRAEELTPLATEFRYPGDQFEPLIEEARPLLQKAQEIFVFVGSKLDTA
jgi:HEPN domain-containing protein